MVNSVAAEKKLVLVGMPDREAMPGLLEQTAKAALAADQPLSVLTLDLDHFKLFRDAKGQSDADAVLKRLAALLTRSVPAGAGLAHLSGDEFVVMLPNADLSVAMPVAESLRAAVESHFADLDGPERLTITIGVAASPADKRWTGDALLSLADARMTFAKKRLTPHHNLVWGGTLPSDWYGRLDIDPSRWPSL